jgi:hypothetical protein
MTPELLEIVEILLNTRDFCGNEREAMMDWQSENRQLTPDERRCVLSAVNSAWGKSQVEAKAWAKTL